MLLEPKQIVDIKIPISGISAGRHHSAAWSNSTSPPALLVWGINGGQLGLDESIGEKVLTPKEIVKLNLKGLQIMDVKVTEGATVVLLKGGHIYAFQDYQVRRIFYARPNEIIKICAVGGRLSHKLKHKSEPLNILTITSMGNIYLWQESTGHLTRCIFSLHRHLFITDAVLNKAGILFVTRDGEGFQGVIKKRVVKAAERQKKQSSDFHNFLEKHACESVNVTRLKNIHRAVSVSSDTDGTNFAVLQIEPTSYSVRDKFPIIMSSVKDEYLAFYKGIDEMDAVHDMYFKVSLNLKNIIMPLIV